MELPGGRRTVGRNVTAAEAAATGVAAATANVAAATTTSALGKSRVSNHQEYDECSKKLMHCSSASQDGKDSAAENHESFDQSAVCNQQSVIRSVCRQCVCLRIRPSCVW